MRNYLIFMIAIGNIGLFAENACADSRPIGKHEPEAVIAACAKAGGVPYAGQGYGCVKENCDGKGGNCTVSCDSDTGACTGHTPGRILLPPGKFDLIKILRFSPTRPAGPPGSSLLDPTPGASPHGPSGPGAPKPSTPPAAKLY